MDLFGATGPNGVVGGGGKAAAAAATASLMGAAYLMRSATWQMYGCAAMVSGSSLSHLCSFSDVASAEDSALAYAQLAHQTAATRYSIFSSLMLDNADVRQLYATSIYY
jgi:hypothetical protein